MQTGRGSVSAGAVGTLAGLGKAATDSLAAAVNAADMPLWLLGVRCLGSAAAVVTSAMAVSRILHERADSQDAGEVRTCGLDKIVPASTRTLNGTVLLKCTYALGQATVRKMMSTEQYHCIS